MKPRVDPAWLDVEFEAGRSVDDVASEVQRTARGIREIANRNDVALPQRRARARREGQLGDADWLRDRLANGATVSQLAHELRVTVANLREALDGYDIASEDQKAIAHDATIKQLLTDGLSYRAVARRIGISPATVRHRAATLGVRSRFRARRIPELHDRLWLIEAYEIRQLSIAEVARRVGTHAPTVRAALVRHRIEIRLPLRYDHAAIVELLSNGILVNDVAERLGCSAETVRRVARKRGIVATGGGIRETPKADEVLGIYQRHGTVLAVAKHYKVSFGTAERWLAHVGVFQRQQPRISEVELRRAVRVHGSTAQIARSLGVDPQVVTIERIRHGL